MNPKPGEVRLADLGLTAKTRPVVIVSREDSAPPRALAIYVPLTTQNRGSAYEIPIPKCSFLHKSSIANVQGIAALPTVRLERKLGKLDVSVMRRIKKAIVFALDLESESN